MRTLRFFSILAMLVLCTTGCGSSAGPAEPEPGPTDPTEPNDFVAHPLGTLSSTDFVVAGTTASGSDVDLFSVVASETVTMLVSLDWTGTSSDLELAISNSSGVFVRNVDTAGHPEACTLSGLPAGTYTVRVGSFTDNATNYSLTIGKR